MRTTGGFLGWAGRRAAAAVVCMTSGLSHAQMPATVVVDEARLEPVELLRRVTGQVRASRRSKIASQEAGWLVELMVREGDVVERGGLLARLDHERAELAVREAEARALASEARLEQASIEQERSARERDRIAGLAEQGIAGEQEVDDATSAAAGAEAARRTAVSERAATEASLALARRRLQDTEIRAPYAGRVVALGTEVGEWVDEGGTVIELIETDRAEIWADIPERLVRRFRESERAVQVECEAAGFEGVGDRAVVVPAADPLSRIFPLRISVDATGAGLLPGMSAAAYLPTGTTEPTLTIHKDAILRDDAGLFVYFAVPYTPPPGMPPEAANAFEYQAAPARVHRLFGLPGRVAVRGSLPPGALVVVQGNERLYPSQPLVVTNSPSREPEPGESAQAHERGE